MEGGAGHLTNHLSSDGSIQSVVSVLMQDSEHQFAPDGGSVGVCMSSR